VTGGIETGGPADGHQVGHAHAATFARLTPDDIGYRDGKARGIADEQAQPRPLTTPVIPGKTER